MMARTTGIMVIALAAAGCGVLPPLPSGSVLFQDDFARESSGWGHQDAAGYRVGYVDGAYQIQIDSPETLAWRTPGFDLGDVRVDVDTHAEGPLDNAFGLICRYQDPGNFYFLLISSDGFSGIGEVRDGERSLLTGVALLPSDAILQGPGPNHVRAECLGPRLRLWVNGLLAQEALVAGWDRGDVGVMAGSYAEPGVVVRFDNFAVTQP